MSAPDHITISINNTLVHIIFSISGVQLNLISSFPLSLGSWHDLTVQRYHTHAVLQLVETLDAPGYITSEAGLREGLVEACR